MKNYHNIMGMLINNLTNPKVVSVNNLMGINLPTLCVVLKQMIQKSNKITITTLA